MAAAKSFSFFSGQFPSAHTEVESAVSSVLVSAGLDSRSSAVVVQPIGVARPKHNKPAPPVPDDAIKQTLGTGLAAVRARLELDRMTANERKRTRYGPSRGMEDKDDFDAVKRSKMMEARASLLNAQYRHTIIKWSKQRKCRRCSSNFRLVDSIGQWNCFYHPGEGTRDGLWTCCSKPRVVWPLPNHDGCTRCDHTDRNLAHDGVLVYRIPALLFDLLRPVHRAVVISEEDLTLGFGGLPRGTIVSIISSKDIAEARATASADYETRGGPSERELSEMQTMSTPRALPRVKGIVVSSRHGLSRIQELEMEAEYKKKAKIQKALETKRKELDLLGAASQSAKRPRPTAAKTFFLAYYVDGLVLALVLYAADLYLLRHYSSVPSLVLQSILGSASALLVRYLRGTLRSKWQNAWVLDFMNYAPHRSASSYMVGLAAAVVFGFVYPISLRPSSDGQDILYSVGRFIAIALMGVTLATEVVRRQTFRSSSQARLLYSSVADRVVRSNLLPLYLQVFVTCIDLMAMPLHSSRLERLCGGVFMALAFVWIVATNILDRVTLVRKERIE